jgi:hypothetical protein
MASEELEYEGSSMNPELLYSKEYCIGAPSPLRGR